MATYQSYHEISTVDRSLIYEASNELIIHYTNVNQEVEKCRCQQSFNKEFKFRKFVCYNVILDL